VSDSITVIQVGLGALGRRLTPFLLERPSLQLVGAVDPHPDLAGRDLGEVAGLGRHLGLEIVPDLWEPFSAGQVDVALQTTVSSLSAAALQIQDLLHCGAHVVSSCEELSYPWQTEPYLAAEIDRQARAAGRAVLGVGVNPGFLMDFLPLALTAICRQVRKVTVLRYQDARARRLPFQRKIGAGLSPEQFDARKADGSLRHVGLIESMHMIASRLGWTLDRTQDTVEPIIAEQRVASDDITVEPGQAAGVRQLGLGFVSGEEKIRLDFRASLGEPDVQDTVIIDGDPPLRFTVPDGVNGDIATCALLTNAIPSIIDAEPGLRTMADLPPITWSAE